MEETNYRRKPSPSKFDEMDTSADSPFNNSRIDVKPTEESRAKVEIGDVAVVDVECNPPENYNRKSYMDKLKVFDTKQSQCPNRLKGMILRPIIFLSVPIIFYAGFSYGSNLIWFNVLNGTASLILSEKPYEFSSSTIGLAYFCRHSSDYCCVSARRHPGLNSVILIKARMLYTGAIGDRLVLLMARRNGGIMESEHRLWLFSLSILFIPGSLLLWGVRAAHGVHWFGLIFAMGIIGFTNGLGLQLSVSYCIDSYRELSGEAIVTVILIRNTMSFAMGYGYVTSRVLPVFILD